METTLPLVAVITPVYNGSPWLERTMACVQRQTYPNIVHVLLDNASTDDTPEVIERFRNGAVPLLTARNAAALNQTANWNAAFKMTPPEAKYAMLLCADDLIRTDAIEKMVARAEEDSGIVLVTAADVMHDQVRAPLPPGGKTIVDGLDMIRAILNNTYNHFAWQCFFVRWRPEDAHEDYFATSVASLDIDKLMKIMKRGKVGFVLEPLTYTRHHAGMMSAQFAATKNPNVRLWRWAAVEDYARLVFKPHELERCIQAEKRHMMRFELAWRLAGAKSSADTLYNRLRDAGRPPRPWEYIWAVLGYPIYRYKQQRLKARANWKWPEPITEEKFVASVGQV